MTPTPATNNPAALPRRRRVQVDIPELVRSYQRVVDEYWERQSTPRAAVLPFAGPDAAASPSTAVLRQLLSGALKHTLSCTCL